LKPRLDWITRLARVRSWYLYSEFSSSRKTADVNQGLGNYGGYRIILQPNDCLKQRNKYWNWETDNDKRFSSAIVRDFFKRTVSVRYLTHLIRHKKTDILRVFTLFYQST